MKTEKLNQLIELADKYDYKPCASHFHNLSVFVGENASLVSALCKKYQAMQQKLDAVLAENAALKTFINKDCCVYRNGMVVNAEAYLPDAPATDAILNAVRADAVRKVVHEADGYEKQFQRDLTPAEWRTLVVNYFGVFDGLSRPIDTAKGGGDDK